MHTGRRACSQLPSLVTSHDERILSLATDTWSSREFNTMLANLKGCQHFCRPSLHENVTVRPVSEEDTNMSCISQLASP